MLINKSSCKLADPSVGPSTKLREDSDLFFLDTVAELERRLASASAPLAFHGHPTEGNRSDLNKRSDMRNSCEWWMNWWIKQLGNGEMVKYQIKWSMNWWMDVNEMVLFDFVCFFHCLPSSMFADQHWPFPTTFLYRSAMQKLLGFLWNHSCSRHCIRQLRMSNGHVKNGLSIHDTDGCNPIARSTFCSLGILVQHRQITGSPSDTCMDSTTKAAGKRTEPKLSKSSTHAFISCLIHTKLFSSLSGSVNGAWSSISLQSLNGLMRYTQQRQAPTEQSGIWFWCIPVGVYEWVYHMTG